MKYSVEITLINDGRGPYNIQIGEIPGGNFALFYPKMAKNVSERIENMHNSELKSGRIISSEGYVVSELEINKGEPITALSWKTVRPCHRKKYKEM